MKALGRRGFLLGTTALVASSSPAARVLAAPAPATAMAELVTVMTATEVRALEEKWLAEVSARLRVYLGNPAYQWFTLSIDREQQVAGWAARPSC